MTGIGMGPMYPLPRKTTIGDIPGMGRPSEITSARPLAAYSMARVGMKGWGILPFVENPLIQPHTPVRSDQER